MWRNPNQARVSHFLLQSLPSIHHRPLRIIPESVTAPAGLLEGQGWGQDRIHNTGSPGEERTSHVEGVCPHPHPLSPAPLQGFPGLLWRQTGGEGGCPHPHLLSPAPLLSPQQALLPSMEGENVELGDTPPRGRTRLLQSQTLPPGKQIPELNRNRGNQKVPSLTPNSTTRL